MICTPGCNAPSSEALTIECGGDESIELAGEPSTGAAERVAEPLFCGDMARRGTAEGRGRNPCSAVSSRKKVGLRDTALGFCSGRLYGSG